MILKQALFGAVVLLAFGPACRAQENYEIQVYPSDTVERHRTMVEFHTNFTVQGRKTVEDGVLPTHHAVHETLEITHGFNDWFETGFYVFTSIQSRTGWDFVGSHLRPRVRIPEKWKWPVGLSLSTEFGYVRPVYAADTWTWEIRPIVDKKLGKWYLAFNPALEKSFRGPGANQGWEFVPNAKLGYDLFKKAAVGLEYYGGLGPIGNFDPLREQQQQVFAAADLDLGPKWEVNLGAGWGGTRSTDHLLLKLIVGYRFARFPWLRFK